MLLLTDHSFRGSGLLPDAEAGNQEIYKQSDRFERGRLERQRAFEVSIAKRAVAAGFGGPYDYLSTLPDSEKPSATIPQDHPPRKAVRQGEAFRSPSYPEEDPSKTSSAEKG